MAVSIRTRTIGPTNYRGKRIVAELAERMNGVRERVVVAWDYGLTDAANHEVALRALLAELQTEAEEMRGSSVSVWAYPAQWIPGATDDGYAFVFVGRHAAARIAATKGAGY